jgi:tetratricopeptide (TPR) repeat protein
MSADPQLGRLDALVAAQDREDSPTARWIAADALYKKAEIIEERDGPAVAAALYADVARRLEGAHEPKSRQLLIWALNDLANIYNDLGEKLRSREVAQTLVADHFDDPPAEAVDVLVSATLLLVELVFEAGEPEGALELLDRLAERYGRPGRANHRLTAAAAEASAAGILGASGRRDEGIRRYERVIEDLGDATDDDARRILACSMGLQAQFMYESGRIEDGDARCRRLIERFDADDPEPEVAGQVAWARQMLEHSNRHRRRWFGRRR